MAVFFDWRRRRDKNCPLAVPEKIFGLPLFLDFFDRCANPCSLHPPLAARAGVARAFGARVRVPLFHKSKKTAKWQSFLIGGEGGTRTLAPVTRPTPLAGAPRHQLEYFSIHGQTGGGDRPICPIQLRLAERKGFEPLALSSHRFSRPAP